MPSLDSTACSGDPIQALQRACNALRRGRLAAAAAELDWVRGRCEDPDSSVLTARLSACVGHYDRALGELLQIAAEHPLQASGALDAALGLTLRVGWSQDAGRVLAVALDANPTDVRLRRVAVGLHGRDAPELAIAHARRALAINGAQPRLWMELAALAAEVGDFATARRAVRPGLRPDAPRPFALEAARILMAVGDREQARELLLGLAKKDPADHDARRLLAGEGLRCIGSSKDLRSASRATLQRIRCLPADVVLRALDELVKSHADSAIPLRHRGALWSWLGDVERARADFESALRRGSEPWLDHLGLADCALLEADGHEALRQCERAIEGRPAEGESAVLARRGEALEQLGRIDDAARDLQRAFAESPTRLGTRIALAVVRAKRDGSASIVDAYDALVSMAPGLLSDAADVVPLVSYRCSPTAEERLLVLERARRMMRGNRSSSCHTYFAPGGALRSLSDRADPHTGDEAELDLIEAALAERQARNDQRPHAEIACGAARAPGEVVESPLGESDIEHFLRNGYVAVRGAIARETCEELIDRLHTRLRAFPERWLRQADPRTLAALRQLAKPDDPAAWPAERLNVEAERSLSIAELCPRVWGAICHLLGGPNRIATHVFHDAFILSIRDFSKSTWTAPSPSDESWHYDHPGSNDTLRSLTRGLVAIVYFSDVDAESGATFVAPESVPLTIRWMAESSTGVDLADQRAGVRITRSCKRFDALTGKAGDVFLVHPLMAHSSSPNTSGRLRYMGNPMVYLRTPLRFDRDAEDELSPLEISFSRALERSPPTSRFAGERG